MSATRRSPIVAALLLLVVLSPLLLLKSYAYPILTDVELSSTKVSVSLVIAINLLSVINFVAQNQKKLGYGGDLRVWTALI